jgi:hypothetical protein
MKEDLALVGKIYETQFQIPISYHKNDKESRTNRNEKRRAERYDSCPPDTRARGLGNSDCVLSAFDNFINEMKCNTNKRLSEYLEFNDAEDDDYTASESSIVSSEADDGEQNKAIEHERSCQQDVNKQLEEDNYLYSSSKSSRVTRKKRSSSLSVSQPSSKKTSQDCLIKLLRMLRMANTSKEQHAVTNLR